MQRLRIPDAVKPSRSNSGKSAPTVGVPSTDANPTVESFDWPYADNAFDASYSVSTNRTSTRYFLAIPPLALIAAKCNSNEPWIDRPIGPNAGFVRVPKFVNTIVLPSKPGTTPGPTGNVALPGLQRSGEPWGNSEGEVEVGRKSLVLASIGLGSTLRGYVRGGDDLRRRSALGDGGLCQARRDLQGLGDQVW